MNPYTPIRRDLGRLRAVVEEMYQDALREELAHVGARLEPAVEVSGPAEIKLDLSQLKKPRRGRQPKVPAPPPAPLEPGDSLPRPRRGRPPREPRVPGAGFEPAE